MKWQIPAKTFLLGEYAAIAGEPAILLTTSPCFTLTLTENAKLEGIHPESPAGLWWQKINAIPLAYPGKTLIMAKAAWAHPARNF
nr:hypothetical protein [Legionella pneumophila]